MRERSPREAKEPGCGITLFFLAAEALLRTSRVLQVKSVSVERWYGGLYHILSFGQVPAESVSLGPCVESVFPCRLTVSVLQTVSQQSLAVLSPPPTLSSGKPGRKKYSPIVTHLCLELERSDYSGRIQTFDPRPLPTRPESISPSSSSCFNRRNAVA